MSASAFRARSASSAATRIFTGPVTTLKPAWEPPESHQVLQPLALGHEWYALGFERPLGERKRDRVRGLEDGDEPRSHDTGYLPR